MGSEFQCTPATCLNHGEPTMTRQRMALIYMYWHICGKLVFATGWDSFGPWPSRRCVDHAVARYRDVYASTRRSSADGVLQGYSRDRTVEGESACACVCALLHIDTHAG